MELINAAEPKIRKLFELNTDEERQTYVEKYKLMKVNIIVTFHGREQNWYNQIIKRTNSAKIFLKQIFKYMTKSELQQMWKISTSTSVFTDEGLPQFLNDCNGKFVFGCDFPGESDDIRLEYLNKTKTFFTREYDDSEEEE